MGFIGSFFGSKPSPATTESASAVDVVTYLASLASDPMAINPMLDVLRTITARLGPDKPLTVDQQKALAVVFHELEQYLLTKEPFRAFDKQSLKSKIDARFPIHNPDQEVFWENIKL